MEIAATAGMLIGIIPIQVEGFTAMVVMVDIIVPVIEMDAIIGGKVKQDIIT